MELGRSVRGLLILSPALTLAMAGAAFVASKFREPVSDAEEGGSLVVVAVFDQLRGDYLERWAPLFGPDGVGRMKAGGAWYSDAHIPYAVTTTGPGHATIATGAPPCRHGVVDNEWYDRASARKVYCASGDRAYERVPLGPRRQPLGGGLSPDRMLVGTVGDALVEAGRGRVFSLALKDRAAVLMGGKSPTGVYCFDAVTGEFVTSGYYRDRLPGWVTKFNAGPTANRWLGYDWVRLAEPPLYDRHAGPDDGPGERASPDGRGRLFPHPTGAGATANPGYYEALQGSPAGNELLWELAKAAIDAEGLGRAGGHDLLWLGFSANDLVGHAYGPDSHEVLDATLRTDKLLGEMLQTLDAKLGAGRYTLILSADHGVCPLPESAKARHPEAERFTPAEVLGPLDAVLSEKFGHAEASPVGRWVERLDYPWLTLNRRLIDSQRLPASAVEEAAAQWAGNRPAVAEAAFSRTELLGPPLAHPIGRAAQLSFHPDRCGDVYVTARAYALPTGRLSTGTTHGSPHAYDTHVPILAYGAGVPPLGQRRDRVSSLAVAPIVAHCLGLEPLPAFAESLPAGW